MNSIMRVIGNAKLSVVPDCTRLSLRVEAQKPTYEKTLAASDEITEQLQEQLQKLGFAKKDLKTTYYTINAKYELKMGKQRLVGYLLNHQMVLDFDNNPKLLGQILDTLSNCEMSPIVNLSFFIKNEQDYKDNLLKMAVQDAKRKAQLLAEASNVQLLEIIKIDHSTEEGNFGMYRPAAVPYRSSELRAQVSSTSVDVTPQDIDFFDSVTILWAIKSKESFRKENSDEL